MKRIFRLGLLVALFQAIAIVRWDLLLDDWRPLRIVAGVAWGLLLIAADGLLFALVGWVCRRRLPIAAAAWLLLTVGGRYWGEDRFDQWSLSLAPLALGLAVLVRDPSRARADGVLAVLLALPALWGRAPTWSVPGAEQALFHLPAIAVVGLLPVLPWTPRRALAAVAATAAATGLAVAVAAGGAAPAVDTAAAGKRPNVLFILVDTLRQDHVGAYSGAADASPGVDRLAREGLRFADAVTVVPKTTQSVAAFHTGKYPVHNGVRVLNDTLRAQEQTLAELFLAAGYRTGAFVHNGWIVRGRGFEQGFEQFWSFFEIERAWGPLRLLGGFSALDALTLRRVRPFDGNTDARAVNDRALAWLADDDPRPFFAYLHYFDPHWPYRPPGVDAECLVNNIKGSGTSRGQMMFNNKLPDAENDRARELYGLEVQHNDDQVGRLLDWLDTAGLAEDTIVVFTADHGHHLGDHDYWYHHGEFLYEPGLRIPMLLRYPAKVAAGQVHEGQARSLDLMPTLLGLAGLGQAIPAGIDGVDLLGSNAAASDAAFLETDISYFRANKRRPVGGVLGKVRGLRRGQKKLIYTPRAGSGEWELYDLQADPLELSDQVKSGSADPALLLSLIAELGRMLPADERSGLEALGNHFDRLPPMKGAAPVAAPASDGPAGDALNATERKMLEALGYVE